jgi:hypothetical protein
VFNKTKMSDIPMTSRQALQQQATDHDENVHGRVHSYTTKDRDINLAIISQSTGMCQDFEAAQARSKSDSRTIGKNEFFLKFF